MYTRLSLWTAACLSLSALPSVTAFIPYHFPDDDGTPSQRRGALISPHISRKSSTLPSRRVQVSRDNKYTIVKSKDPSQENSVAIDQDGSDLSYMVAVTFGDSKEEYQMLLDSAASSTWVMGKDCEAEPCGFHNLFGKGDSSSLQIQTEPFDVTYGTGTVSGTLAKDTINIGSLSVPLTFGIAANVSKDFSGFPFDGILGIGRGEALSGTTSDSAQIMEAFKSSKAIGSKLYGVHMSRAKDGLQDGELNFGAANKARYDADLNTIKTIPSKAGFWEIELEDAGVDSKSLGFQSKTAIMDTGTSFILIPQPDAEKLHNAISGSTQNGETFQVPCDTKATVFFQFNGHKYNVSATDLVGPKQSSGLCRSSIVGRQTFGENQWLVGDAFLKNVYAIFDFESEAVGLGVKNGDNVEQSSSASPSATESPAATGAGGTAPGAPTQTNPANPTSAPESQSSPTASASATAASAPAIHTPAAPLLLTIALALLCLFM